MNLREYFNEERRAAIADFLRKTKEKLFGNYEWKVDFTSEIPKKTKSWEARLTAAGGYLIFIIPLWFCVDNQFARFHGNQALINTALSTIIASILNCIPVIGWALAVLQLLICMLITIRGIILSLMGKAVSIPLVGWITLLRYRYAGQREL